MSDHALLLAPALSTPVVCLTGPTASGKTAAALAIARAIPCEIISVDSALVYRGMDIGTAKPSAQELAAVPHHLIDIRDPSQAYSAAEFVRDATQLVRDIRSRGKLPLLVGGTMLYLKALFDGLDAMPAADPLVRAALEAQAQTQGWAAMHTELTRVDPITAARLHSGDSQRIQRALEVYRITGQAMSSLHSRPPGGVHAASANALISLEPSDRAWLHERIAQRFDVMLRSGFMDEMNRLRARGDLKSDMPSMRCVGYRQAWEALDGTLPMDELRDRGIFATRQLAKRQITWLRSMPQRHVVACDAHDAVNQVVQLARELVR